MSICVRHYIILCTFSGGFQILDRPYWWWLPILWYSWLRTLRGNPLVVSLFISVLTFTRWASLLELFLASARNRRRYNDIFANMKLWTLAGSQVLPRSLQFRPMSHAFIPPVNNMSLAFLSRWPHRLFSAMKTNFRRQFALLVTRKKMH